MNPSERTPTLASSNAAPQTLEGPLEDPLELSGVV